MPLTTTLPDISIRQLEYLVAVSESPTWAVAAGSLGVSPSALSQGLAELERRVGVTLFERDGRRRLLREAASPVLDHARHVLALTGDLERWATGIRTGVEGKVRVGMIDAAAVVHFPDVLRRYRAQRHDVDVHLTVEPSASLLDQLATGGLDLAVCVRPPVAPAGIEVDLLLVEDLAVYPPARAAVGEPATWGPWVLFPEGSHTRAEITTALTRLGAPVEIVAESHQPDVLREMVRLGLGWTVLPVAQAESGGRPLRRERVLTTRELVVATRAAAVVDPAVGELAAALLDEPTSPNPPKS